MGMSLWALWGSKHDEKAITLEEKNENAPETKVATAEEGANARSLDDTKTRQGELMDQGQKPSYNRSRSRRRTVTDEHQTDHADGVDENTPASHLLAMKEAELGEEYNKHLAPDFAQTTHDATSEPRNPSILISEPASEIEREKRPRVDGIAIPFSLKKHSASASMTTLTSTAGIMPSDDVRTEGTVASGVKENAQDVHAANSTGNSTEEAKACRSINAAEDATIYHDKGKQIERDTGSQNGIVAKHPEAAAAIGEGNQGWGGTKVVENGQVVSSERPALETFLAAQDFLPTSKASE